MKPTEPTAQPSATARCKTFAVLLPVLDLSGGDARAVEEAREHLAVCAYCQAQQAAYRQLDAALYRHLSPPATPRYQTEEIVKDVFASTDLEEIGPTTVSRRAASLPPPGRDIPRRAGRTRQVAIGLASLAAVLALALGATLFFHVGLSGTGGDTTRTKFYESTLGDVAMVSPTEGWAVGGTSTAAEVSEQNPQGEPAGVKVALWHYLRGHWSAVDLPIEGYLSSISMVSPTDGWAVGENPNPGSGQGTQPTPLVLHYNGQRWQQVKISASVGVPNRIYMLSPTDGWMVGDGFVQSGKMLSDLWHYDGQAWSPQALPAELNNIPPEDLSFITITMLSPTDGWAIAITADKLLSDTVLLHYTDGQWKVEHVFTNMGLPSLTMLSDTDGWLAGSAQEDASPESTSQVLLHYVDGQWKDVTNSLPNVSKIAGIAAVSMRAANDGWAVVIYNSENGQVVWKLLHYDGTGWTEAPLPTIPNTSTWDIRHITMLSASEGWAVGEHEVKDAPGYVTLVRPVIFHYFNGVWSIASE